MKMLTEISPTGPHGLDEYVQSYTVPFHDTHNLPDIMSQNYEPEPPVGAYVNPQLLQPNNRMGIPWGEPHNYSMPNQ